MPVELPVESARHESFLLSRVVYIRPVACARARGVRLVGVSEPARGGARDMACGVVAGPHPARTVGMTPGRDTFYALQTRTVRRGSSVSSFGSRITTDNRKSRSVIRNDVESGIRSARPVRFRVPPTQATRRALRPSRGPRRSRVENKVEKSYNPGV